MVLITCCRCEGAWHASRVDKQWFFGAVSGNAETLLVGSRVLRPEPREDRVVKNAGQYSEPREPIGLCAVSDDRMSIPRFARGSGVNAGAVSGLHSAPQAAERGFGGDR